MKRASHIVYLFIFLGHAFSSAQDVGLTIEPAVELKIQTREGFRYDIEESATMSNFQPNGFSVDGTGETESLFFPVEGKRFFRATEIPTEIRRLVAELEIYSLNTARVSSNDGEIQITGARIVSRDYDEQDFATLEYCFDFSTQSFAPKGFTVIEDVGPTLLRNESFFPLDDPTEQESVTYFGDTVTEGSTVTLNTPGTGGDLIFNGKSRQFISYEISGTKALEVATINSDGDEVGSYIFPGGGLRWQGGLLFLEEEARTLRLTPLDGNSASHSFVYKDGNGIPVSTKEIGDSITTESISLNFEYQKFRIAIQKDKRISLSGYYTNGGTFTLCKLNGERVDSFTFNNSGSVDTVLGPVPETADYFLVFFGQAFESNRFSGTISEFVE